MPDDPVKGGYFTTERKDGRQQFWVLRVYTRHDGLYVSGVYTSVDALRQDCAGYKMRGAHSRALPIQFRGRS